MRLSTRLVTQFSHERNSPRNRPYDAISDTRWYLVRLDPDYVESRVADKSVDGDLLGADPCPVRVDIACETPPVVGRPDEGQQTRKVR